MKTISKDCRRPAEVSARLKELFADTLETMLEAEMEEHLGYEKHSPQELVGGGHHVNLVGFSLQSLLIHKLENRIIGKGVFAGSHSLRWKASFAVRMTRV